jgi:diaminopimelate decarboxylase
MRVNPNIEVDVHHYISTGKAGSKFGLDDIELKEVVSALRTNKELKLVGLHCHLGSTIESVDVIGESTERLDRRVQI